MRLYVMRHGPAEDRSPTGRDFDRALTPAGREVVERAARALAEARGAAPLRVLASPFVRAWQTAELVASALGAGEPERDDDLGADAGVPLGVVRAVRAAGVDAVLVGHQPFVEELVRVLAHPAPVSGGASGVRGFRTATIASLAHAGDDRWRLEAVIDPHGLER
jgi:phosphohistidine phosphatase